jgi:acetyl esterase/lipase
LPVVLIAGLAPSSSALAGQTLSGSALETLGDDIPEPPAGFETTAQVLQAMVQGEVKSISRTGTAPEGVKATRNMEYGRGGNRTLRLDLFQPESSDAAAPGLIFIHGGGWSGGGKSMYEYYGGVFAQKGYVLASIDYRLSGEAPFPAALEDCKCAVRWMRANAGELGVDPDRIAVAGGSAGGHLALLVGYTADLPEFEGHGGHDGVSSAVRCVVDIYGPTDLTADFVRENAFARRVVGQFLGASIDEAPNLYEQASPVGHVDATDPPTLILHGTIDDIVPIHQGDLLAKELAEAGVPYVYDRLPGWPHAMDLAQPVNDRCVLLMDRFFQHYLREAD